jgi:PPK2 family polyphosphate:nucleotide phosphotransferase
MLPRHVGHHLRVKPGTKVRLKDHDPGWADTKELRTLGKEKAKRRAIELLERNRQELGEEQSLLYAAGGYAVLIVLQGMDGSGKDGTISHVMSGVNPQGCQVAAFKRPSTEELEHDFLWRCEKALPARGRIGIFNRSYYEEVIVVRVHPELLDAQKLPPGERDKRFWETRYESINAFEHHLVRNGTIVLKFFLHLSKHEQKRRFLERLDDPAKNWKFSAADLAERGFWKDYMDAYEAALSATSTRWAPWYIVPADQKWVAHTIVADILVSTIRTLDLRYPKPSHADRRALAEARRRLEHE